MAIFPDRVEWSRKGWIGTGTKAGLAVMTMGMSLAATGIRRHEDGEIIPISSISHVAKRRGKGLNTVVVLATSGGDVAMRVHHGDADRVIDTILRLQRGEMVAPAAPVPTAGPGILGQIQTSANELADGIRQATNEQPAAPAANTDDVMTQLKKLGELRDAGILSEEEFTAKKTDLLARL
nr:SHOCT domain-containing protein [Actinomyces oris]